MASIALGNASWTSAVQMLTSSASACRDGVIASLHHHLKKIFNEKVADWFCTHWNVTE
jgi:hypothetical protein